VGFPLLVSAITDPFGREARFRYDTTGRLVAITDIIGITSSFSYDANNLVNTLTTPYGTSHFLYTAPTDSGPPRFVDVQDPLGRHEREEWVEPSSNSGSDPSSSVPVGMPQGVNNSYLNYRTSFHWNKDQYVAAGCTTDGGCDYTKARATQFTHYNGTSLKATAINTRKEPLENRVWFNYSDQTDGSLSAGSYNGPIATGRVVDDGSSQISLISYDTAGFFKPTRFIDPMGRTLSLAYTNHIDLAAISRQKEAGGQDILAQYIYDTRHRPVVARDAAGGMSSYAYNAAGQLVSRTNPLNQTTTYAYDTLGELLSVTNANGKVQSSFTYDAFGRVATVSDSEGWTKRYDYDAADRPTRVTYPDGSSQTYRYDRLDLAVYTNRSGQSWHYTYDAGRNLTSVTDPAGEVTAYARNGQGQVTTLTDPRGNETQFAYDVQGRLTSRTYADHSAITYGYAQTISRLISRQDALGQVTHYTYGLDGLLLGRSYTNAVNVTPGVSYVWDRFYRRQVSMTDGNGTTSYSYGAAGSAGAQRLTGEVGPQSDTTRTYGYDVLGRLVTRTTAGGGAESFRYDALGRLIGHGNDLGSFTLAYLGQTAQVSSRTLDGSTTLGTVWGYQDNTHDRRLASVSNTGLSATQRSVFALETNQLGQVTSVDQSGDAVPETLTASARTLSYNALNQAITMNGQAISYDANGNLLSDGTRSFSWDAENRLIGVSTSAQSGANAHYSYDGRGRRVSQSVVAAGSAVQTTTSWLWCGNVLCQARDASGTVLREILSEGEYLPGQSPQALYYGVDQIGSVRRVFATAGSAPAYDYDAYGLPLYTGSPLTLRGYAGLLTDPVGGTSGARYRTYDPLLMRWLSRDPLGEGTGAGQGTNLYGYVLGDPLGATDPSGMLCWPKWLDDNPILEALGLMLALGGPEDPLADALALAPFYDEVAAVAAEVAEGIGAEAADLVSSSIGEGAAEEGTTSLYRAVGPAELEDIQATGAFRNLGWAEGKYFTTSGEAASSYARQAVNSFGDRPYTIVQSNVPNSVLKGMSPVNVDGGIPAYVIPNESLPSLTPNIMNYSPIPGVK
jgi:RHS repeat-associated protein